MHQEVTLFLSMFTTLLAIINPLEALPVFLTLLEGKDDEYHRRVARRACLYAMLLTFFFLFFWSAHTVDFRGALEHGPYCRGHYPRFPRILR
jgi:small neutral amino acid transporter SnatA (MarC family)